MSGDFTPDEKMMALFAALAALARTLSVSGALDRTEWLRQLTSARAWLVESQDASLDAFDALMDMLTDV